MHDIAAGYNSGVFIAPFEFAYRYLRVTLAYTREWLAYPFTGEAPAHVDMTGSELQI